MNVAAAIWKRIAQETNTAYFVPGGGAMFLVDALGRSGLAHVSMIHEQGAGIAAIGHAMASGGLGVCLTTSGPGATNALTACLAAWTDSVPVLFVSGQARTEQINASRARARGLQYADIVGMARQITKASYEPQNGTDCLLALEDMIAQCLTARRGPCWLSVPQDVQGANYG